ncbi:MAG: dethiobiotin synthase [Candidatus Omnitrophica bacterium]|nr:dethiobiotin synthase [Candidatus Omnitrophota bacterium]
MRGIFVTGTGTGVGKTVITGLLARYLLEKDYSVVTQKWVQTGSGSSFSPDILGHLKLMRKDKGYIKGYLEHISPYSFKFGASPHLASRMEHKNIREDKIIGSFKLLSRRFDFVLVEGLGGALVPLNNKRLVIDLAKKLRLPVLVVAENKLGAINHALLTIESLRRRRMHILGIVFNNAKNEDKRILKDNPLIVRQLSGERILGVLPWVKKIDELYNGFLPIGKEILKRINELTTNDQRLTTK